MLPRFRFCTGDVDYLTFGGTWVRHLSGNRPGERSRYHFIRLINWEDACGRDAPPEKYNVGLGEVSLDQITKEHIKSALESCGQPEERRPLWIAYALLEYGLHAPLLDLDGNNFRAMYRQCAAESQRIEQDLDYRYERMNRPVNKLGSTAAEFMRGDLDSALQRGLKAGDLAARIIDKMQRAASKERP